MKKKLLLINFMLLLTAFALLAGRQPSRISEVVAPTDEQVATGATTETTQETPREQTDQETLSSTLPPVPSFLPMADYSGKLQISELMVKNKAAVPDASGGFCDWAELENISGEELQLNGWSLSDREGQARWGFPEQSMEPGERLLVFFNGEEGPDFSLSKGETLYLLSPGAQVQDLALCEADRADCSLIRQPDGSFRETPWISPGFENSAAGYEAWCDGIAADVTGAEFLGGRLREGDYAALRGRVVRLAGVAHDAHHGGEVEDQLFLRDSAGQLLDYVALHDIPVGGSLGRMEGRRGFFYFAKSSPGAENGDGQRRVTDQPLPAEPDGVYDGVESVTVTLVSPGEIHYTTDGTVPTLNSPVYSEPLVLTETTVIRALAREEDALTSPVATYSYIVNENHTLPVMSLVVDDFEAYRDIWYNKRKHVDVAANLALYDGEHSFNHACDLSMKGYTSLDLPKKSMGVSFKGRYGGNLECDVFGNGVTEFSSLAVRAGQDYTFSIFRNELFQDLCLEAGNDCLTQSSKYCILYLNGRYFGIYCLKEDFSKQYYASHAGVSKDSVVSAKCPVGLDSEYYHEVLDFVYHNDLTVEENYQYICDHVNIDSLIDWFLLESYCANTDIQGNTKMFRSPENGNRWTYVYYDLDWGFWYAQSDFTIIMREIGNAGNQMPPLIKKLLQNRYFRDKVLYRFAELNKTVLSNEHVLQKIDEYQALLEPEIERERERWYLKADQWYVRVDELRKFITNNDWEMHNINQICRFLNVGELERKQIFGR